MAINYVKFIRGTPTAFTKLSQKDNDTLYFISETNSKKGSLYLGEKLISESIANLEDLSNILLENVQDKNLLSYDANGEKWVNKPIIDAIGLSSIMPPPLFYKTNKTFLHCPKLYQTRPVSLLRVQTALWLYLP